MNPNQKARKMCNDAYLICKDADTAKVMALYACDEIVKHREKELEYLSKKNQLNPPDYRPATGFYFYEVKQEIKKLYEKNKEKSV